METSFDKYNNNDTDKNTQRLQSILEGIVTIMKQNESLKQQISELSNRVSVIEHNAQVQLRSIGDTLVLTNNITNDIDDIKGTVSSVSDKVDNVDYDIKNIRIFKYYNGE